MMTWQIIKDMARVPYDLEDSSRRWKSLQVIKLEYYKKT
jgi:hypothetical protein